MLKRIIRHSNPSADSFGSANKDADIYGIAQDRDAFWPTTNRVRFQDITPGTIPTEDFFNSFRRLMDNMASTETNDKAVLEHLVTTTTTQYAAIKALLQEIKYQRGSNNSKCNPGINRNPNDDKMRKLKKRNAMLQHVLVQGWTKGGFCSSHGHGVPAGHDSRTYPNRKPGHVETATRNNPSRPAQYLNKGWDAFCI